MMASNASLDEKSGSCGKGLLQVVHCYSRVSRDINCTKESDIFIHLASLQSIVVGCFLSLDDQQSYVWHHIEEQKDDFEKSDEQVNDCVVAFPGNGEPSALQAIHEIRGEEKEYGPQNQDAAIDDCTPHEERCECLNTHNNPPFS